MTANRNVQVGALFFTVLTSLFVLTVFIGDITFFKDHYLLTVEFEEVAGLQTGDRVLLSGVQVGKVERMRFVEGGTIDVILKIEKGPHTIYENAPIWIASTTPLGGKHVEIGLPPKGEEGPLVPQDGTARIKGREARDIGREVESAAKRVGDLAEEGKETFRKVNAGEGTIGTLLNDETMARNLRETLRNIREASEKINVGDGVAGELLNDRETAENLKQAIANVKEITRKINEGEGALGKLVSDKALGEKTEQLIDSGNAVAGNLKRTFSLRTFIGIDSRAVPEQDILYSKIYLRIEPDDSKFYHVGAAIIDIDRSSPWNTPRRLAKITADDDEIEFEAEILLGWRFLDRQLSFAVGLLEGQPGGTLTVEPSSLRRPGRVWEQVWLNVETRTPFDTSDLDEGIGNAPMMLRTELGANLRFAPKMPILKVHAGAENVLDDPVYAVGFGIELEDKDIKNLIAAMGSAF